MRCCWASKGHISCFVQHLAKHRRWNHLICMVTAYVNYSAAAPAKSELDQNVQHIPRKQLH